MTDTPRDPIRHLYVHIPFCPSKCSYCAFETHIGSLKLAPDYVDAVISELRFVVADRPGSRLETVYFGGGTPSMLAPAQIASILGAVHELVGVQPNCEITLEAHPTTVCREKLSAFRQAGITRISFGGESLEKSELTLVGRGHAALDVLNAIRLAQDCRFESVGLDLIYGLPGQSLASWLRTIRTALDAGTDHLSLYPLSVEPKTVLAHREKQGRLVLPDDDIVVEMYHAACSLLREAGFEHYEVANWARAGHRCRHNLAYWLDREYFGIGVGAHGYVKPYRTVNISGTRRYIEHVAAGRSPALDRVTIDPAIELEEVIMLGLRLLSDGLCTEDITRHFGVDVMRRFGNELAALSSEGFLDVVGGRVLLRESAVPVANEVWERLLAWN